MCLLAPAEAAAQLDILQPPPSVPSLPDPPALQHALFENPIPPIIAAIALALAAYAIANRLGRRRLGLLLAAAACVPGLATVALSLAVKTDRERIAQLTRSLVAAVANADADALDQAIADDALLMMRGAGRGWSKDRVIDWVAAYLDPSSLYALEEHRVTELQAEIEPNGQLGRTRASITLTPANAGSTTRFICMITWRKEPPGSAQPWTAVEIEPLWLQGWGEINAADLDRTRWR